ncbi:MAG: pilus assembly protein FimV [Massilia sp.]|nr:pilus assembly protein FimV [Massilia sp.]
MNRLKSGQILSVPDSEAIRGSGEADAHGVVVAHAADFNAYRNKLAGQVANAAPAKSQDGTQSASGKIIAKVEERATAANESKDQLKLSKAASGALGKSVAPGTEESIANNQALADSTARVKELERNVSELEKLMAVKSKSGSEASKSVLAEASKTEAAAPVTIAAVLPPVAAKPAPVPVAVEAIRVPESVERSFADLLMNNITMIGAALALLLLGWFGLSRRKPKDTGAPVGASILGAPTGQAHSMFDATGGHSVDTSDASNSVFNSSFAPSASQLDTNEVDPVAEADVYIAYGRDAQAEEILKEALRTHPERTAVRLKLLEIYAARKDVRAFEVQAGELYGMSRGQGDDWAQAAALGLTIDPLNPLYAPASVPQAPLAAAAAVAGVGVLTALHANDVSAVPAHDGVDLGLDQGLDKNQNLDQDRTAAAEPHTLAALPNDEPSLDFDLDGLGFETAARMEPSLAADPNDLDFTSEPVLAPAVASEQELPFDLAFDLAFDSPSAANLPLVSKPLDDLRLDLASDKHSAAFDMAELAREFDLPHLAEGTPAGTVFAEPLADPLAESLADPFADPFADPLAELDAMNFDLPGVTAPVPPSALDDDLFALPDLPGAAPTSAAASHFDIADIDLDLDLALPFDTSDTSDVSDTRDVQSLTLEKAQAGEIEMSASQMEMETKLDLAIAYQEIGDKEGARELLDEVIKGGSDEQVSKANAMRSRLA